MSEQKKIVRSYADITIDDLLQLIEKQFYEQYYVKFDRFQLILQIQRMYQTFKAINMTFQRYVNILYHNIGNQTYFNIETPEDALGWQLASQYTYYKPFRFCLHKAILQKSEVYYLQEVFEEANGSGLFILNVWYQINMIINLQNKQIRIIDKIANIVLDQDYSYYLLLNSITIPPQVSFVIYNITHLQLTCIFNIDYSRFNLVNVKYLTLKETEAPNFSLMHNLQDLLLTEVYDLDLQVNQIPKSVNKLFINQCEDVQNIISTIYGLNLKILCLENISLNQNLNLQQLQQLRYLQLYNIQTDNIVYKQSPIYNGKLVFQLYQYTLLEELTIELTNAQLILCDICIDNIRRMQFHNSKVNIYYDNIIKFKKLEYFTLSSPSVIGFMFRPNDMVKILNKSNRLIHYKPQNYIFEYFQYLRMQQHYGYMEYSLINNLQRFCKYYEYMFSRLQFQSPKQINSQ